MSAQVAGKGAVLISGASRGIGRALCTEAIARGYEVHALVRRAEDAPAGTRPHVADIRETAKVGALLAELAPKLTHFIANAGVDAAFDARDPLYCEKAATVFEINGTATAYSLFRMASEWIKLERRGGHITVVSSLAAGRGYARHGVYVATKTAQLSLAQGLWFDLKRFGIGVSVVQPGFVETDMSRKQPMRPTASPSAAEGATMSMYQRSECFQSTR